MHETYQRIAQPWRSSLGAVLVTGADGHVRIVQGSASLVWLALERPSSFDALANACRELDATASRSAVEGGLAELADAGLVHST